MKLETIFGSRTRLKLLRLLFSQPEHPLFVREISRAIGEQINSVRRELANLEKLGLVEGTVRSQKKYYQLTPSFPLYTELRQLILKAGVLMEQEIFAPLQSMTSVVYVALCGQFVNDPSADIDLFIVGDISKVKMEKLLAGFQQKFGKQLRFTMMKQDEFMYRKNVTDKFVHKLLTGDKILFVDRLGIGQVTSL